MLRVERDTIGDTVVVRTPWAAREQDRVSTGLHTIILLPLEK